MIETVDILIVILWFLLGWMLRSQKDDFVHWLRENDVAIIIGLFFLWGVGSMIGMILAPTRSLLQYFFFGSTIGYLIVSVVLLRKTRRVEGKKK